MKYCKKKYLPNFNSMVIFKTDDFSYHGHPDPLTCPENITRKSIALYYYIRETSFLPFTLKKRNGLKWEKQKLD